VVHQQIIVTQAEQVAPILVAEAGLEFLLMEQLLQQLLVPQVVQAEAVVVEQEVQQT
jgi:hypothetical protein